MQIKLLGTGQQSFSSHLYCENTYAFSSLFSALILLDIGMGAIVDEQLFALRINNTNRLKSIPGKLNPSLYGL
jgi:hypothetical protein